jgi:predicted Zn-dependent protease
MLASKSTLNIVRIGSDITYSSLKEIGENILTVFRGIIEAYDLRHHEAPVVDRIDALLLTMILNEEVGGHTLGITDADLRTEDQDEFYSSIIGGKNPLNDIAVVSTKKLSPPNIASDQDYSLFLSRTLKVALHEIGHNLGLTDHATYKMADDGQLCPMSKGEFNKFGYRGYVRAVIDGRGFNFCEECTQFLGQVYGPNPIWCNLVKDGLDLATRPRPSRLAG